MKNKWLVLSTGFALFAMFFGSGNLVFPLLVGKESHGHFLWAGLGILLTGVAVPFLGVLGMMLFNGNIIKYFSCFGKRGTFLFSFLALALMGPFGVLARCLTVAHGALLLLVPNISLPFASFLFCLVIYFMTVNKNAIVSMLGSILTPLLLLCIAIIAFAGVYQGIFPESVGSMGWFALKNGFFQGYQTMDLIAAFFFSQFVIADLKNRTNSIDEERVMLNQFYKSALIGAVLLSMVYLTLVLLGSLHASHLEGISPQEMLGKIAIHTLGPLAAPIICLVVLCACLTTAIVLASLFADFFKKEIVQDKVSDRQALFFTLLISFVVSTFDFAGIARFLGPVLEAIYPALIVLTVYNIASKLIGVKSTHWPFSLTIAAKLLWF